MKIKIIPIIFLKYLSVLFISSFLLPNLLTFFTFNKMINVSILLPNYIYILTTTIFLFSAIILYVSLRKRGVPLNISDYELDVFDDSNHQKLIDFAKIIKKTPITKTKFKILNKAYTLLNNKNNIPESTKYDEAEHKILSTALKIIIEHLEVEFLTAPNNPLKLENLNEEIISSAVDKLVHSSPSHYHLKKNSNDIDKSNQENGPIDKRKLH